MNQSEVVKNFIRKDAGNANSISLLNKLLDIKVDIGRILLDGSFKKYLIGS